VQNRVAQALPKLPEEVRQLGVTTTKQSPDLTMVVHLVSPNNRYDEIYLRNYATLQVKDVLARIPGAGSVQVFGSGDYAMRVWLDPNKIAAKGLTASDVVGAIREQNVQIAAGGVGQPPVNQPLALELQINAKGRLITEEEFGQIIVKTGENGEKTLLKDIARIELGASGYSLRSLLNNKTAVAIPIFQLPGANALQLSKDVRRTMEELKQSFPDGVSYSVVYDPTVFVRHSIEAVVHTLFEALLLVVIVVILFLQTWRASLIPLAAVPVSLVGTFAVMLAFGFSINALSLFGLVLAIGIVVDDAIVVLERGSIVEIGKCSDVLARPLHPYTRALVQVAMSAMNATAGLKSPFAIIDGDPPDPARQPAAWHGIRHAKPCHCREQTKFRQAG
jgi:multidrug efflux pump